MRYVTFFTLIFSFQFLPAQAPTTLWSQYYDFIFGMNFIETYDHGFMIIGNNLEELVLARTDSMGDTLWTKVYDQFEPPAHILSTPDSGFVIAATTIPLLSGTTNIGIFKSDENGDTLWTKIIGTDSNDYLIDFQPTSDSGYVILANSHFFNSNRPVLWLIKTDFNGDTLWSKILGTVLYWSPVFESPSPIVQTSDSGYILTGDSNGLGILLLKMDSHGNIEWQKSYVSASPKRGIDIIEESYGYLILYDGSGVSLMKTDFNGDTLQTTTILSNNSAFGYSGISMHSSIDGTYIITGGTTEYHGARGWILAVDNSGNLLWMTDLLYSPGYAWIQSSITTHDSCYVALGRAGNYFPLTYLFKLSSAITTVDISQTIIDSYHLYQNYPNPFNPYTTIEFDLPKTSDVTLKIFNILGEELSTLISDRLSPGTYSCEWGASEFATGVYLYRLETGNFVETRKMILLR